jgi:hypothetical protein
MSLLPTDQNTHGPESAAAFRSDEQITMPSTCAPWTVTFLGGNARENGAEQNANKEVPFHVEETAPPTRCR